MRFAYIDSQGNRVGIPGEDALRLRIELGAIVDGTSFCDADSEEWAPAAEHEVYRRLKRALADQDAVQPLAIGDLSPDPPPTPVGPTRVDPTPADPTPVDPTPVAPPGERASESFDFGDFGALDLEEAGPVHPRSSTSSPESPSLSFDEPRHASPPEPSDPWTVPGHRPWPPDPDQRDTAGPARPPLASVPFGDDSPPHWDEPDPAAPHPFTADEEMPDWLRDDPEFGEGAPPPVSGSFPTREDVRERYEREHPEALIPARSNPLPRLTPRRRGVPGWVRIALGVGVVGATVWGGFRVVARQGDAGAGVDGGPVVELPALAPSLEPVLRVSVTAAYATFVDSLQNLEARRALVEEPDADWLGGRYMAGAAQYPGVRLYWEALGRYVQVMRAREDEVFATTLGAVLDTMTLPVDDRSAVEARARAGFEAAAPDRLAVYGQLRTLADAALSLHEFLEENESDIDYEPATSGLSRDPVLEAVPLTDALGEEMWNRVAEITSALDNLGFLDRVTTTRMLDAFFAKLAEVPVR